MVSINKNIKLVTRATLKLTLIYTGVIFVISLCFSVAIGGAAIGSASQPFGRAPTQVVFNDGTQANFSYVLHTHNQEIADRVVADLIFINIIILVFGAGLSFILARWTLQPIEETMRDQADFVANASHELKTPLAVMQTENEVLLRSQKTSNKQLRERLVGNLAEIQKLRKLTDYLLMMNAQDNDEANIRENDLLEILHEPLARVSGQAKQKDIKITRHIEPLKITTDADKLSEIVYILLDNAIKYSPNGSTVAVVADHHTITVTDQGPGVSDQDRPLIFERFYRSDKSHTSDGFGLGLALAQSLSVKIHAKISERNVRANNKIVGAQFIVEF